MSELINVLVTGANGQLGNELKVLSNEFENISFVFTDKDELDITNEEEVNDFFSKNRLDYCINCAAYTAVDKAEDDEENAFLINVNATKVLAQASHSSQVKFIHISTDFVFSGNKNTPYNETDITEPLSVYGITKLQGEEVALKNNANTTVIRTSWLYSSFGGNFVKTMLKLAGNKTDLNIISDQIGAPTYANDLAQAIIHIILAKKFAPGIYHYSNEGITSWYDFTKAIFQLKGIDINVNPISTEQYPTPAKRPQYSVMDKSKIKKEFGLNIPYWRDSLIKCLNKL